MSAAGALDAAASGSSKRNPYLQTEVDFGQGGKTRRVDPPTGPAPATRQHASQPFSWGSPKSKSTREWRVSIRKQEAFCESGSPAGCAMLGLREWDAGNYDRAHSIFQVACVKKSALACIRLGGIELERGRRSEAADAFQAACGLGDEESCRRGIALPAPRVPAAQPDDEKPEAPSIPRGGRAKYELLCQSSPEGCAETGVRAYAAQDLEKGVVLLTGACDRGAVLGCLKMAEIFRAADDDHRVKESLRKACGLGHAESCSEAREMEPGAASKSP